MVTYYKPRSPIQSGEDFIYPITTADQIIKSDKSRRLEQAGLIVADNSTSLGGVAAKDYALKTDTAPDSSKLGGKTLAEIMLTIYPVGSVYISMNSTSPASLFGGTWEILNDVFLLAAGSYANAGTFGGEAAHALTVNEMPVHHHSLGHTGNHSSFSVTWGNIYANVEIPSAIAFTHTPGEALAGNSLVVFQNEDSATATSGGGAAHNNLPPYMAVYMWKRVS